MKQPLPPKTKDKLAGRYLAYWWLPDITNTSRHTKPGHWRRQREKRELRRYLASESQES